MYSIEKLMAKLEECLDTNKTCPDVRILLVQGRADDDSVGLSTFNFDGVHGIFSSQKQVGWKSSLEGYLSIEWAKAQDTYFK